MLTIESRPIVTRSLINAPIPIVALWSPGSYGREELEMLGVSEILPKPAGRELLLTGVENALLNC